MVASSEQLAKDRVSSQSNANVEANNSQPQIKKKKRSNRQRNRPRNKRNRVADSFTPDKTILIELNHSQKETDILNCKPTLMSDLGNSKATTTSMKTDIIEKPVPEITQQAASTKTREQILAEREAKKLAKQAKKNTKIEAVDVKHDGSKTASTLDIKPNMDLTLGATTTIPIMKTREEIQAEREAIKAVKNTIKAGKIVDTKVEEVVQKIAALKVAQPLGVSQNPVEASQEKKKPVLTKAERRAIQEAQRAAKAQSQTQKTQLTVKKPVTTDTKSAAAVISPSNIVSETPSPSKLSPAKSAIVQKERDCKVKLFNHLNGVQKDVNLFINDPLLHPSIARLGVQYAKRTVVGSNARCIAFLNALKMVVRDFETPPKKEFTRSLEAIVKHHVEHLHKCRPLAVSVSNAYKQFNNQLLQLPADKPETDLKETLSHFIDTYIENQIGKAALAISASLQEKIADGDVLLTFGCSSLIHFIFEGAKKRNVDFRVIVVDSRPYREGQEMLRRLTGKGIPCTYVLINAISFVMPEATKVLLGAHALLSNGYVMARTGTAQVALVAHSYNVPVLVCCETHKFSERFQTDAIVYNELGDPDDLIASDKCCLTKWKNKNKMTPLNLNYDITPPELVTAVVTEVSILPCTSVPVILRIKPDIGY